MGLLLDRVTSETLQWNVVLRGIEPLRSGLDSSANRLSFSVVVAALIMGSHHLCPGPQQSTFLLGQRRTVFDRQPAWTVVADQHFANRSAAIVQLLAGPV